MASRFHEETLKIVVAQLCQNIGFQGILSSSLDVLVDLLHRYLNDITISTHHYTEHYGRTIPTLDDLGLALQEMGVSVKDLEEYVNYVEPVSFPYNIPKLPIPRPLNLNFLKPGAREILSRPLHIHEHLPPMYPEKEEEENISNKIEDDSLKEEEENTTDVQVSLQEKRPIEEDTSVNKKLKMCNEEEGEPVREIDSVMMTTSGYISSAREGKMPDARRPAIPMSLSGRISGVTKNSPSVTKKKATMEKIIKHKKQGGILPGPSNKPKVKHTKLKTKIPLAPPGTGSLKPRSPGSGQAPKLKIPNMNKEKEANPLKKIPSEKDGERKKKDKKERLKKQKIDGGSKKKKEGHRQYKYHFYENRKERTRIRMRGLSKEEELKRYKERENELIAALAASSAVTVTTIPAPALRVREKSPETSPSEGSSKNKLSVFRKFPKGGSKDGGGDSSPDLMIDAPVVKEEKLSPPPSPNMDIPNLQEEIPTSLPPTPRAPELRHPFHAMREDSSLILPHKIKKENPEIIPVKKKSLRGRKRKGSTSSTSPSFHCLSDHGNMNRSDTSEGNLSGSGDIPVVSPLFTLPPFSHGGPSHIPPFSRFPFIPPFGASTRPPLPDLNPMSHLYMESSSHLEDKVLDNFENNDDRPPTPKESITPPPVNPSISTHLEVRNPATEKLPLSPPPKGFLQEIITKSFAKLSKLEKEKKKEHKREKKEKEMERLKRKKEKKEKEKREKEEKKKEKKEERERLKRERKEKKKSTKEGVPKITLQLPSEGEEDKQTSPSESKVMPKLIIKPVLKHPVNEQTTVQTIEKIKKKKSTPPQPPSSSPPRIPSPSLPPLPSPPPSIVSFPVSSPSKSTRQESPGSPPAIAKFSALVTRPPKGSQTKKSGEMSVPLLKIKDRDYKISSKKESSGSIRIESKEATVPPLKIKSSASLSISSTSSVFIDDKKSFYSKKSEKKEKKKMSPLIITTVSNINTGGSVSVTPVCSPTPPPPPQPQLVPSLQLPPPILLPSEVPSSKISKKPTAVVSSSTATPGTQTKSVSKSSGLLTETVGPIGHFVDDQGNEVWICPTCGKQDDGTPMIGCDTCDDWYHWVCVGINVPPSEVENWYCPRCLSQHKQQRGTLVAEKKKRGRKRKII